MKKTHVRKLAAAAVVLALSAGGCYVVQPGYGPPRGPGAPPGPAGGMLQPRIGIGASLGVLVPSDEWLIPGPYLGGQVSLWLSEMMALQIDVGATTLKDDAEWYPDFTGDLTVVPMTVSAIFSIPDPYFRNGMLRWRFGVGAGVVGLDHSEPGVDLDPMGIVTMHAGTEFVLRELGGGRFFVLAEIMFGEEVEDEDSGWYWDLTTMSVLRVGLEFQF